MTRERLAAQIIGALLVAALTFFFMQSRVDHALPRQVAAEVQALTQRDAMLNRDLVLARYGHLPHVDPLVEHMHDLRAHAELLGGLALDLPPGPRLRAQTAIADLEAHVAEKAAHLELFKSDNAVLHSSTAFFPRAVQDVLTELDNSVLSVRRRLEAERAAGTLLRAVLRNTRPGGTSLADASAAAADQLRAATADGSQLLRDAVERLTAHLDLIAHAQATLDQHLEAATATPVSHAARTVDTVTAAAFASETSRAGLFRALLFGTAVLLVAYLAVIMARLRVKAQALKRAIVELRQEMVSRARAEDQLKVTEKVFENAVEGVLVCDAAGLVVSVNPAFTAITGVEPGAALGLHWGELTRDSRADTDFPSIARIAREAGQWQGEVWNTRPDGRDYALMMTVTAIHDWEGRPRNFVAVFHDVTDAKASAEELHFRTYHDPLTGLANRAMVKNRLGLACQLRGAEEKVALALLDLDNFRTINDSLGHTVGDALLKEVGARLADVVDVEAHTIGRLGGDEYALVLRGLTDVRECVGVLRQVFQTLAQPLDIQGHELFTTASVGLAIHPGDGHDAETLFKNADVALNRAKEEGRNNFQFYTQDMEAGVFRRLTMEANLRRALKRDEFLLVYQPKICTRTGRIVGLEALVRWAPPGKPLVSPAEFIPVAEQTGLIVPLGRWILREACAFAQECRAAGRPDLTVAVNLSARQFHERALLADVAAALTESGLPPANLELEITESMVMSEAEEAIETLRRLKAMGLSISVDDFGTGYSSLSYLKRFPLDALKIDQGFVRDLTTDAEDRSIVAAIISLARSLGLQVVAEGVETADHLDHLAAGGCDLVQGYLISRPLPQDEAQAFLRHHADGWDPAASLGVGPGGSRRDAAALA
ncbi:diguanylate cyclase [Caenispirillum salinarum AK4]|uniref:Diguanylate cyclase n=1 Tax=Caenispirillum salinarum AK4 TaxID=1238182 RepID=K9HVN8_9PROT|nr:EAL domain-containing protein [Caenispirillum salinarum]EKV32301.1 diguanylate cyclase [Caenispirillum salinarum AK4]